MRDTLRLGRIGGIGVGINWTLLVMAGVLAVGLAANRLPLVAPGYSSAAYSVVGVATAAALLAAVFLHELGHAIVARRAGLRVDGITLWFMGGVTRIEGDSPTPGAELRISGVGPLVSLALGGLFLAVHAALDGLSPSPLLGSALLWLAVINVALAVFNLLPGAPLDGGRLLHAMVWRITRNPWRATRVASGGGIALGILGLAGAGAELVVGQTWDAVWIGLLGWFLLASARAEVQNGRLHYVLDGTKVADLMRPVVAGPGWLTVGAFLEDYGTRRPDLAFLLERWGGGWSGVVTGDLLARVPEQHRTTVRAVDVAIPIETTDSARPDEDALTVLERTGDRQAVIVTDGTHSLGAVLPFDVASVVRRGQRLGHRRGQGSGRSGESGWPGEAPRPSPPRSGTMSAAGSEPGA